MRVTVALLLLGLFFGLPLIGSAQDSDGDGRRDAIDCAPHDPTAWTNLAFLDSDLDSIADLPDRFLAPCFGAVPPLGFTLDDSLIDNCPGIFNPDQSNVDDDGTGDACDPDADNDGVPNELDCAILDSSAYQDQAYPDPDQDGAADSSQLVITPQCFGTDVPAGFLLASSGVDNCPGVFNPDQLDTNSDGIGDACAPSVPAASAKACLDFDGDNISDVLLDRHSEYRRAPRTLVVIRSSDGKRQELPLGRDTAAYLAGQLSSDALADLAELRSDPQGALNWQINASDQAAASFQLGSSRDRILSGCDFDGDGVDDPSVVGKSGLSVRNSSNGSVTNVPILVRKPKKIQCLDLDGDGHDELAVYGQDESDDERLWAKHFMGYRPDRTLLVQDLSGNVLLERPNINVKGLVVTDIDGDHKEELAYYNFERPERSTNIVILHPDGDRTIATPAFNAISQAKLANGSSGLILRTFDRRVLSLDLESGAVQELLNLRQNRDLLDASLIPCINTARANR